MMEKSDEIFLKKQLAVFNSIAIEIAVFKMQFTGFNAIEASIREGGTKTCCNTHTLFEPATLTM